jgi:hypothetical protein
VSLLSGLAASILDNYFILNSNSIFWREKWKKENEFWDFSIFRRENFWIQFLDKLTPPFGAYLSRWCLFGILLLRVSKKLSILNLPLFNIVYAVNTLSGLFLTSFLTIPEVRKKSSRVVLCGLLKSYSVTPPHHCDEFIYTQVFIYIVIF